MRDAQAPGAVLEGVELPEVPRVLVVPEPVRSRVRRVVGCARQVGRDP